MSHCLVARSSNKLENGLKLLHVVADETLNRTMYNVIISIVMSNLCRFYIMAAILDFRALEREKNGTLFFLMFISYSNRIRRVFAFTKKYTNFYFMTNEPTLIIRSVKSPRRREACIITATANLDLFKCTCSMSSR